MTLVEKVEAVEQVFQELDSSIATFQNASGLHCKFGCGKCCYKADLEASPLEFLPFALYLHKNNLAFDWLDRLSGAEKEVCLILNPTQPGAGLCSAYTYRGLICRLFGYSARTNKYGSKELVTCQIIKSEQASQFAEATARIQSGLDVPVMTQYYMRLHGIDPELSTRFFPINRAIQVAIETVLHYYAYREHELG